ncbi:MAG: 50S ribosomal protein L15 [Candidatus Magasanikbacteria bacterium]|nr:50S ribosomal protein L15 [Candidatus Magasanikbacteria bacterium]MCA9391028.1 50S ribosomal protein L15 [Candidatus Magasanikbacteria bacterium]USN52608.1 MAG: 50S ribosomal protein L15 [Candidatus Nomurabacteria bacterium]
MSLTLHSLKPKHGSRKKSFRIGRGEGTGIGKTSGRGANGQKSRSGGKHGLKRLGMKSMLLSFPKVRGFRSRYDKATTITLKRLEAFETGSMVTMQELRKRGLVTRTAKAVKIVGNEAISKKLNVSGVAISASAKAAIEAAGGSVKDRT